MAARNTSRGVGAAVSARGSRKRLRLELDGAEGVCYTSLFTGIRFNTNPGDRVALQGLQINREISEWRTGCIAKTVSPQASL
jgi:hypothetical protein